VAEALSITVGSGEPEDQLPPGTYPATLDAVVERTITVNNEDRDVFEWTFLVDTENEDGTPGEPIKVSGLSSKMTGPQSKTATFLVALLGPTAVQPGATFTMNDLAGKRCLITTVLNKGGYAKVDGAVQLAQTPAKPTTNRAAAAVEQPAAAPVAAAAPAPAAVAAAAAAPAPAGDDDLPF
jgi:hypothetical protein